MHLYFFLVCSHLTRTQSCSWDRDKTGQRWLPRKYILCSWVQTRCARMRHRYGHPIKEITILSLRAKGKRQLPKRKHRRKTVMTNKSRSTMRGINLVVRLPTCPSLDTFIYRSICIDIFLIWVTILVGTGVRNQLQPIRTVDPTKHKGNNK